MSYTCADPVRPESGGIVFFVPSAVVRRQPAAAGPAPLDEALAREALASDRLRAALLAGVLTLALATYLIFYYVFPSVPAAVWHGHIRPAFFVGLFGPAIAFELLVCWQLGCSLRAGRRPPPAMLYAVALAETSLPSAALLLMSHVMDPLLALTQTPTHHYYLFILLSTLRLDPRLCVFTGAVAAIEYFALAVTFLAREALPEDPGLTALPLHVWKAILYLLAGIVAAFVAAQIRRQVRNSLTSLEAQKRVRDVFGRHVSPQVVDQLLGQEVDLGGEVRRVCVLFLDIRDFTHRSSHMAPAAVVEYLNVLFEFMIDSVNRHGGIVNKFLGDGFMAVFGAPVADGRASQNAIAAAREILQRVDALNAQGGEPTRVGMGLHAGPVLAGEVGSAQRKEYTIIGDTVNLASRIEGLNKQFGSQLLISEEVWRVAGADAADAVLLGPVAVKGKDEPVPVFRLA